MDMHHFISAIDISISSCHGEVGLHPLQQELSFHFNIQVRLQEIKRQLFLAGSQVTAGPNHQVANSTSTLYGPTWQ